MKPLDYHGSPCRWRPAQVVCVNGGAPLSEREPPDVTPADARRLLQGGYGAIVMLEPGDHTRYSVVLTPLRGGFCCTTTGRGLLEPVTVQWADREPVVVRAENAWTCELLSWWLTALREEDL